MRLPITPGSYEPGSMARHEKKAAGALPRPRVQVERCTQCLACWIYCPDSAVELVGNWVEFSIELCKGCGICAVECPAGAVDMVRAGSDG